MGRLARYTEADILAGAKHVSAERGPRNLTIAAVAHRTGAPVGSIYHRYASRDEILAAVWLELVEDFQQHFLAELEADDALAAGLAAVGFVCRYVRERPREARLLLLHRREDFASAVWPARYRRRAERLAARAAESLSRYAERIAGRGPAALRRVRLALVDLPTAALRRDVEAGTPPSADVQRMLFDTCEHVLRQASRSAPGTRKRRKT